MSKDVDIAPHIQDVIAARMSRRGLLGGLASLPLLSLSTASAQPARALSFASVGPTHDDTISHPGGYHWRALIAWGDALFDTVSANFDPDALTRAEQEQRFGQNADMVALFPTQSPNARWLMCVNHEYVEPALTYPGLAARAAFTPAHGQALYASMGVSVVQLAQEGAHWRVVRDARPGAGLNRRVTPFTPVVFDGPAARHPWIVSGGAGFNAAEPGAPDGAIACGTFANCGGGQTPWGTYLSAEENFNSYFTMSHADAAPLVAARNEPAWVLDCANFGTPLFDGLPNPIAPRQFDVAANPHVAALYGWIVEIDPHDPAWSPRKRTALGRRKAECANTALTRNGRIAVYSGDDQINEFVYKFVSRGRYNPGDRLANRDLLSEGALYAARFDEDGRGEWLALTLEAANAAARAAEWPVPFRDQGDVLMRAREAARLLGATPMDRPEDVEALHGADWMGEGTVLIVCTNNREPGFAHPGNPRRDNPQAPNRAQANVPGHIVRINEARGDCGARRFSWDVFLLAGDPDVGNQTAATSSGAPTLLGVSHNGAPTFAGDRFACPDNICVDADRNIWIATDGAPAVFGDCNDALLVTPADARGARAVKRFLVGPVGCEICGPLVTDDQRTLFVAIQHPGESNEQGVDYSSQRWAGGGVRPASSFPDGQGAWPRSAVVYIVRDDGGLIGA